MFFLLLKNRISNRERHVHVLSDYRNGSVSLSSLIEKTDKVIFNIKVNGESCNIVSASPPSFRSRLSPSFPSITRNT